MARNRERRHGEGDGGAVALDLPSDVVERILAGLPLKSVVRFKSVSGLWNSIISHPHFMKIRQTSSSSRIRFVMWGQAEQGTRHYLFKFEEQRFRIEAALGAEVVGPAQLCSCKGLILLADVCRRTLRLCNPCLRTYAKIPWPSGIDNCLRSHGLCYDSTNDDYMAVVVLPKNTYSVFSCKKGTWSERREFPKMRRILNQGLFAEGACYLLCLEEIEGEQDGLALHKRIVYFDPTDDACGQVELPNDVRSKDEVILTIFRGRVCLCHHVLGTAETHLWTLEKNGSRVSWKELLIIKGLSHDYFWWLCPINDNIVVIQQDFCRFVIYDTSKESIVGEIPYSTERGVINNALSWGLVMAPCEESFSFPIPNTA